MYAYKITAHFDTIFIEDRTIYLKDNEFILSDLDEENAIHIDFTHLGFLKQLLFTSDERELIPNAMSIETYEYYTGFIFEHLRLNFRGKCTPKEEEITKRLYYVESSITNRFHEDLSREEED